MITVEVFRENAWHKVSWHKNAEYALINADVMFKNKNLPYRVIDNGMIIFEVK
jgi:hypothetical protein